MCTLPKNQILKVVSVFKAGKLKESAKQKTLYNFAYSH